MMVTMTTGDSDRRPDQRRKPRPERLDPAGVSEGRWAPWGQGLPQLTDGSKERGQHHALTARGSKTRSAAIEAMVLLPKKIFASVGR